MNVVHLENPMSQSPSESEAVYAEVNSLLDKRTKERTKAQRGARDNKTPACPNR